jgi:hypothetical protein
MVLPPSRNSQSVTADWLFWFYTIVIGRFLSLSAHALSAHHVVERPVNFRDWVKYVISHQCVAVLVKAAVV